MISEVAKRYAKALYEFSESEKKSDSVLNEVRALGESLVGQPEIKSYLNSPIVSHADKAKVLTSLKSKMSPAVDQLLTLLNEKDRLGFMGEIAEAFETLIDAKNGVTRGIVRSASTLDPEQRKNIEETVRKVTGKQVILKFDVDPTLLGGLVAKVAGWTFDDSLNTHLTSLKEGLRHQ
jgi:F-type H+-transporting ATPase subunit delta